MNALLRVIDDLGEVIECYALGYFGDARLRLIALQDKLTSSEHEASLTGLDLKTVIAKACSDHSGGDKSAVISDLSNLSRRLWQHHWENE